MKSLKTCQEETTLTTTRATSGWKGRSALPHPQARASQLQPPTQLLKCRQSRKEIKMSEAMRYIWEIRHLGTNESEALDIIPRKDMYESDATLLTVTSGDTLGDFNKAKIKTGNHNSKHEEGPHMATPKHKKKTHRPATPPNVEGPSGYQLAFMVIGALVLVFAVIFGTIYLIIYRMQLLDP